MLPRNSILLLIAAGVGLEYARRPTGGGGGGTYKNMPSIFAMIPTQSSPRPRHNLARTKDEVWSLGCCVAGLLCVISDAARLFVV